MGINFNAIIDHRLSPPEIAKFDALLSAEWQRPSSPLAAVPPMPGRAAWKWDLLPSSSSPESELNAHGYLEFEAPIDLGGTAFYHALHLNSAIRWGSFLAEEYTQQILHLAAKQIANIVQGSQIVFLPDSIGSGIVSDLLHDGNTIDSVLSELSQTYGPPAPSLVLLKQARLANEGAYQYFVERTIGCDTPVQS